MLASATPHSWPRTPRHYFSTENIWHLQGPAFPSGLPLTKAISSPVEPSEWGWRRNVRITGNIGRAPGTKRCNSLINSTTGYRLGLQTEGEKNDCVYKQKYLEILEHHLKGLYYVKGIILSTMPNAKNILQSLSKTCLHTASPSCLWVSARSPPSQWVPLPMSLL